MEKLLPTVLKNAPENITKNVTKKVVKNALRKTLKKVIFFLFFKKLKDRTFLVSFNFNKEHNEERRKQLRKTE